MKLVLFFVLLVPGLAASSPLDECRTFQHHGQRQEAQACFARLAHSNDSFLRAEGEWGLGRFEDANAQFKIAYDEHKDSPEVRVEWGKLFVAGQNMQEAANLFQEAVKLDENYAPAYLALGRLAGGFDKKSEELTRHAIELDPKFVEAHEYLARLALENDDPKLASEEAHKALSLSSEALDAMSVLASMDWLNGAWLNGAPQSEWMTRILKINPIYGEAYATGAYFFIINRRYEEGVRFDREALKLNEDLSAVRSDLGINLLRLGQDEEARQQLERSYNAHYAGPETRNALRFLDTVKDYEVLLGPHSVILLHKKEAALLGPYIQPELEAAIAAYQKKYKMTLPGPVRLEVYPNHDDFIVRTIGLPGQGGLLGVTFNSVVAMDSPSARPPGEFRWSATIWHELSHVYVLNATHELTPRWFTEGLAVHEESAHESDWADRMTPEIVAALQKKQLLPVLRLEQGFLRPQFPSQVLVSYYQAGRICDFIVEKYGNDAILGMIHSFADHKTTAEAIVANLHEQPEAFDKEFSAWLDKQTQSTVLHFSDWKKAMQAGPDKLTPAEGNRVRDYYPEYTGADSSYELLAGLYANHGDKAAARRELEQYRNLGGHNITSLKKLAAYEQEAGDNKETEKTLKNVDDIYLEDEDAHRKLGTLLLNRGDAGGAVREYQAAIALKPADVAETHYDLARALLAAKRDKEAKDEVLVALEAAPGYKPAQKLLLQLSQ
ncbi:MAG TPA: tetratricopeptide repeat protein [Bryobacteraceae bacterium]|nr:tetratricopeptide repeat protein [Bryobacteraceae bacterium]